MYDSLDAIWRGWRRIYLHAFRSRPFALLLRTFTAAFFSVMPAVLLIFSLLTARPFLILLAGSLQIYIWIICWKGYAIVEARKEFALLHPLGALYVAGILADGAWIAVTKQKTVWR